MNYESWIKYYRFIIPLLPSILYFPNFLFDFPDKIYLQEAPENEKLHQFYRTVLQDVLDATGEGTNLQNHILDRAMNGSYFDRKSLDSVLLNMGSNISQTVFRN